MRLPEWRWTSTRRAMRSCGRGWSTLRMRTADVSSGRAAAPTRREEARPSADSSLTKAWGSGVPTKGGGQLGAGARGAENAPLLAHLEQGARLHRQAGVSPQLHLAGRDRPYRVEVVVRKVDPELR